MDSIFFATFYRYTGIISVVVTPCLSPLINVLKRLDGATIERKEAAEMLGVFPATINNYVHSGKLSPIFTDKSSHMKYKLSEVLALVKE